MSDENLSDAELVRRVQSGRQEAFNEIDRRYRPVLHRFLTRYTFCVHQAEELVQKTLIRGFEMIGQLESGEKLVGWLHRIAFRMAAAEGRKRKMASLDAEGIDEPMVVFDDETQHREERYNIWQTAQTELSTEEYEILRLRYREDLDMTTIAKKIGKTEGAVRVQLHRARKKLLPFFTKQFAEE
jgi:RNA polymerase sigma-70 factor (ECF subfamily)